MKNSKSNLKLKEVKWLTTLETFTLATSSHPKCIERFRLKKTKGTPSENLKTAKQIYKCSLRMNLFAGCVELRKDGATYSTCHRLSLRVAASIQDLIVPSKDEHFRKWLKLYEKGDITIPNDTKGSTPKVTPAHIEDIRILYSDPLRTRTQRRIRRELALKWKTEGLEGLSQTTIDGIIRDNRNIWDKDKYGKIFLKDTRTRSVRIKPKHAMTMVQMDGSPWNEPFNGYNRHYLFQIVDIFSDKVIGFSIGESENYSMVLDAIKVMCEVTGCLPGEIACDNSSAYNIEEFKSFQIKAERYGTIFTRQAVGNSPGNSQIESAQKDIQTIGMVSPHHFGLSVKSKNQVSRKTDEIINKQTKPYNQPTSEEVKKHIIKAVIEYNNTAYNEGRPTPNELFAQSDKPYAIRLEPYQIAELFWTERRVKVSKGGVIKLTIKKIAYHYILNPEDSIQYAGREVLVKYDDRDLGEVFAFTLNEVPSFLFVAEKAPAFKMSKIEQTDQDKKNIVKVWEHNRQREKAREKKIEESKEKAMRQRELMGELSNWMSTPKTELKKTQEDAAMIKYLNQLHKLDDIDTQSSMEPDKKETMIKVKPVRGSLKFVD